MPSLKITAYQKVYYEKIIDLSQQAYDEILAAPGPDDQQQALDGRGLLPENENSSPTLMKK